MVENVSIRYLEKTKQKECALVLSTQAHNRTL